MQDGRLEPADVMALRGMSDTQVESLLSLPIEPPTEPNAAAEADESDSAQLIAAEVETARCQCHAVMALLADVDLDKLNN